MSVDYTLCNADGEVLYLKGTLVGEGGTFALGGSNVASLNVTYNYSRVLAEAYGYEHIGENRWPGMIKFLDGRKAADTISDLVALADVLPDEPGDDYWAATSGNVGHAVAILLAMARELSEAVWRAHG